MTQATFREILMTVVHAYPGKFSLSAEGMNTWYKHLDKYGEDVLANAIDRHIDTNTFPPSVADIKRLADEIQLEELRSREYVNNNWLAILDARPNGEGTEKAHNYFMQYVYQHENPLAMAQRVWEWVKDYEGDLTLEGMMERLCRK